MPLQKTRAGLGELTANCLQCRRDFRYNGKKVVSIWPVRRDTYVNSRTAWRRQFPLTVSYTLSIHKAQGMSLDRVVLNLEHKEHSPGLCYVIRRYITHSTAAGSHAPGDGGPITPASNWWGTCSPSAPG